MQYAWIDQHGILLGKVEGDAEEAKGITQRQLVGAKAIDPALATFGADIPPIAAIRPTANHPPGLVTGECRMVL